MDRRSMKMVRDFWCKAVEMSDTEMGRREFIDTLEERESWNKYDNALDQHKPGHVANFQRPVRDERGNVQFYINVKVIDFEERLDDPPYKWSITLDAQFERRDGGDVFDVQLHWDGKTPSEIVGFYRKLWNVMSCDYDDDFVYGSQGEEELDEAS